MAVSDLGALGPKEGPPVDYDWAPTFPAVLPWIGIVLLLLLPANRNVRAWWILTPLLLINATRWIAASFPLFIPSEAIDLLGAAFVGLAFGISALWLASPYLTRPSRWAVFFLMLLVLAIASGLAYLGALDFSEVGAQEFGMLMFLAVLTLMVAMALSLTARVCRRRPTAIGLSMVLFLWLAVLWMIPGCAVWAISRISGSLGPQGYMIMGTMLVMALVTFVVVWPFVLLALVSSWYRERLVHLFDLAKPVPPAPVSTPLSGL